MTMMSIEQSLAKILVPESYLAKRRGRIRLLVREEARAELLDIDDPYYGEALCRYLLFVRNNRLKAAGLASLSPEAVFYNGHHWYLMATRLYLAAYDASIRHEPTLSHSIYQAACRTAKLGCAIRRRMLTVKVTYLARDMEATMVENEHSPLHAGGAGGDMIDQLVPESYLAERDTEIRKLVAPLEKKYFGDIDDPFSGTASSRYLLFCEPSLAEKIGLNHLSQQVMFCNRLYWFIRYMVVDGERRGYYLAALQDIALDIMVEGHDRYYVDVSTIEALARAAGWDEKMTKIPWS